MKAKVFMTLLLIAVLSGCEVSGPASTFTTPPDETDGPSPELLYQPPRLRQIDQTGVKLIFSTAFVAIELDAGSTAMPTAHCPDPMQVGDLMNCLGRSGCERRPDPSDLVDLDARAHHSRIWTMGTVGDRPVYAANDSYGTIILADGSVELRALAYVVTSDPSGPLPGDTGWPCGEAPCEPAQCPGGSDPTPRLILGAIDQAVKDNPALCQCDQVCSTPPPPASCPCAALCECPC